MAQSDLPHDQESGSALAQQVAKLQEPLGRLAKQGSSKEAFATEALALIARSVTASRGALLGSDPKGSLRVLATTGMDARASVTLSQAVSSGQWKTPLSSFRNKRIVVLEAAQRSPSFPKVLAGDEGESVTFAGLPIRYRTVPVGVIVLVTGDATVFSDDLLRALSRLMDSSVAPVIAPPRAKPPRGAGQAAGPGGERGTPLEVRAAAAVEALNRVPVLEQKLERLTRQLRWSISTTKAQQDEMERLKEALAAAEQRADEATAGAQELAAAEWQKRRDEAVASVESRYAAEAAKALELGEAWAASEEARSKLELERTRLQNELEAAQQELTRLAQNVDTAVEARSLSDEALSGVRSVLADASKESARQTRRAEEFEQSWKRAETERDELEAELSRIRSEFSVERERMADGDGRSSQVVRLEHTIAKLQSKVHEYRSRESEFTSRMAEFEENRTAFETQVSEQRSIRDQWVTRLEEMETERQRLQGELEQSRAQAYTSTRRLGDELEESRENERQLRERIEKITSAEAERVELEKRCEDLDAALDASRGTVQDLEERLRALRREHPETDPALVVAFEHEIKESLRPAVAQIERLSVGDSEEAQRLSNLFSAIVESSSMVAETLVTEDAERLAELFRGGLAADSLSEAQERLGRLFERAGLRPPHLPAALGRMAEIPAVDPDVDAELLEVFAVEAAEEIEASEQVLLKLEEQPDDRDLIYELFRSFHTLKGAAAAVGLKTAATQLHHGESLLEAVNKGELTVEGDKLVDFCLRLLDSVDALLERAQGRECDVIRIIPDVEQEISLLGTVSEADAEPALEPEVQAEVEPVPVGVDRQQAHTPVARVDAGRLNDLLNGVTRLASKRPDSTFEIEQLSVLQERLYALPQAESLADEVAQIIDRLADQGREFERTIVGVEKTLQELRLAPLETIYRRLARPVRDAARQEKKQVEFKTQNGDVQIDRSIIDALYAPLLHVVRNAVAHGIETPDVRERGAKPPVASILISATESSGVVTLTVEDDGAGIDFAKILDKARRLSMVDPEDTPEREELLSLIFQPGFSTAESTSDLAGRGVGMDVVNRDIEALSGSVDIETETGRGTRFIFKLPVSST